jgi:Protein of unknown function (DUF3305)
VAISEKVNIGVVAERRRGRGQWAGDVWRAVELLPGEPSAQAGALLAQGEGWSRHFLGSAELALYPSDTDSYKFNLESSNPSVFVMLRPEESGVGVRLVGATVCAAEATAHSESGVDMIEAMAMPRDIFDWVQSFVATHHVERESYKRTRDRADPEAMGRRDPKGARGHEDV